MLDEAVGNSLKTSVPRHISVFRCAHANRIWTMFPFHSSKHTPMLPLVGGFDRTALERLSTLRLSPNLDVRVGHVFIFLDPACDWAHRQL